MRYAVYSLATGQIQRVVHCAADDADMQLTGGDALVEMPAGDDSTHFVASGALVAMPARPSEHHVFNWATKAWNDARTLDDFRSARWDQMKRARSAAIDAPLVTPYGTFDSGPKDRTNLTDAILMVQTLAGLGMPSDIDFTLADNTTVTITMAQLVEVGLLLGAKVQAAYSRGRVVRQLIEDATTPAEVQAITWEA